MYDVLHVHKHEPIRFAGPFFIYKYTQTSSVKVLVRRFRDVLTHLDLRAKVCVYNEFMYV